jgi:hypothetical protein
MIVGNKNDMCQKRQITKDEGQLLACELIVHSLN